MTSGEAPPVSSCELLNLWDDWFDFNSGDEIVSTSSDGESFRLRTRSVELYCESSNVYSTHNIYYFFCCIVSMYIYTLYSFTCQLHCNKTKVFSHSELCRK